MSGHIRFIIIMINNQFELYSHKAQSLLMLFIMKWSGRDFFRAGRRHWKIIKAQSYFPFICFSTSLIYLEISSYIACITRFFITWNCPVKEVILLILYFHVRSKRAAIFYATKKTVVYAHKICALLCCHFEAIKLICLIINTKLNGW